MSEIAGSAAVAQDLRVLVDHILEAAGVSLLLHSLIECELSVISVLVIYVSFAFEIVGVEVVTVVVRVAEFHFLELRREMVRASAVQRTVVRILGPMNLRLPARRRRQETLDALLVRMEAAWSQHILLRRHHRLSTHLVSLRLVVRTHSADSCRLGKVEVNRAARLAIDHQHVGVLRWIRLRDMTLTLLHLVRYGATQANLEVCRADRTPIRNVEGLRCHGPIIYLELTGGARVLVDLELAGSPRSIVNLELA